MQDEPSIYMEVDSDNYIYAIINIKYEFNKAKVVHVMEKKYQVFISSTFKDLKKARLKVRDAILSIYHFPVGMEMFGAAAEDQWDIIRKDIDESDYYILIIGKCFGSEVDGEGISYTQKEFRYAVEKGIPVLAFIMKDDMNVPKSFQETEKDRIEKLEAFKKEVLSHRTVDFWSTPNELAGKVISALTRQMARKPRSGWVRASEFDIEKSHAELLELAEKIRALEEENEELRAKTGEKRGPKLSVEAFVPVVIYTEKSEVVPNLKSWYRRLGKEDSERIGVAMSTIGALPNEEEIQELQNDLEMRSKILAGHAWLDLVIRNTGNIRATDITVDIEVPEGLSIYETIDLPMYTEIELPKHEIKGNKVVLPGIQARKYREEFPEGLISLEGINSWDIVDNKAEISISEIRSYSTKRCIEFFVVGNKPGHYELKCTVMCAEYLTPEEHVIEVQVV